jgi:hypothetical protein
METLTRLVSESLARHGFDRPVDYRRLQWSRWFRCESHHSLLVVPSKPGVFALAEEVVDFGIAIAHGETTASTAGVATGASPVPPTLSKAKGSGAVPEADSRDPKTAAANRMLAVTKFFEDDDMAFVLDRMLSHPNPMQARLASGRYFVRFVEIHDQIQRRSICSALNQWIISSAEKATGIGSHFATSLELTPEPASTTRSFRPDRADCLDKNECDPPAVATTPRLNSAVATTIHCSSSFPSGF